MRTDPLSSKKEELVRQADNLYKELKKIGLSENWIKQEIKKRIKIIY
jgi:hypothetical protein